MDYDNCPRENCNGKLKGERINDFYKYEDYFNFERVCNTCNYTIVFQYKYVSYSLQKPVSNPLDDLLK